MKFKCVDSNFLPVEPDLTFYSFKELKTIAPEGIYKTHPNGYCRFLVIQNKNRENNAVIFVNPLDKELILHAGGWDARDFIKTDEVLHLAITNPSNS